MLQNYDRYPLVVESASGCYVFDLEGKRYLDMIGGIGVNALGYGHPRIAATLAEQAARCVHTSNLVYHRYQGALAERLCAMSGLDRAFFSNSGGEAIERALKAVRAHGRSLGPRKIRLVALENSFHGRSFGALAVTGHPEYRRLFEPLHPEVTFVAPNDEDGLARAVNEETAGIVLGPVLGEGGIYPLEDSFLVRARELADRHHALLVADEAQCGLGRTGRHFAFQWSGIRPDLVVAAKPPASGHHRDPVQRADVRHPVVRAGAPDPAAGARAWPVAELHPRHRSEDAAAVHPDPGAGGGGNRDPGPGSGGLSTQNRNVRFSAK